MFKKVFSIAAFFIITYFLFSDIYLDKTDKYFIDYPVTWKIEKNESNDGILTINSPDNSAFFRCFTISKSSYPQILDLYNFILDKFQAKGDSSLFNYLNREALFADLTNKINSINYRGYYIIIKDKENYFILFACSEENNYEINHDFLLSVLNTFSFIDDKKNPGPVSLFYYPKDPGNDKKINIVVEGETIELALDEKEIEATRVVIEREARILTTYTQANDKITPWNRFYNIIYRDNYQRIKPLFDRVSKALKLNQNTKEDKIKRIAEWVQNFNYERTGTTSDLTPPLDAFFSFIGDCDSRSLLYNLFMDYLGIDSIILVSIVYSHSAAAVDLNIEGAKFNFKNKKYLFIELTDIVDIGYIKKEMADPKNWIPMKLGYN